MAASGAFAQSSVELFGIVDIGLQYGHGSASNKTQLAGSGQESASRLGFRGTEDLGGGLKAGFWLEGSLAADNGTGASAVTKDNQTELANTGLSFNRRSTVSLMGNFGEVRLGRDYTPTFWNDTQFDPFGTVGVGASLINKVAAGTNGLNGAGGATNVRASNSIGYLLPGNIGGFYGQLMYAMGENNTNTGVTEKNGNYAGGRLGWANGPVNVALAYGEQKLALVGNIKTTNLAGSYDFGMAKLMAEYSQIKDGQSDKGQGYLLGATAPVGASGLFKVSYSDYKVTSPLLTSSARAKQLALGYVHSLSKRTAMYGTFARINNNGNAAMAIGGATLTNFGDSSYGYDIGIRHAF